MNSVLFTLVFGMIACVSASGFTISSMPSGCENKAVWWSADPAWLAQYNYVEEEYLISGIGNIYAFNSTIPPFGVEATGSTTDYTLRILVHRPASNVFFSGNILVEYFNPTGNADISFVFDYNHDYIMSAGIIHVAVTLKTVPAQYLVSYNPCRYANISMPSLGAFPDMTTDLGNKLKSNDLDNPLRGYNIKAQVLTSFSQSGGQVITFINWFHALSRTASGANTFDGYYLMDPTTFGTQDPATATRYTDSRRYVSSVDVPVMRVRSQELLASELLKRDAVRQPQTSTFRNYEIAGAGHLNAYDMAILYSYSARLNVSADETGLVAGILPPVSCVYADSTLNNQYVFKQNLFSLFLWINNPNYQPADNVLLNLTGPIPADNDTTSAEPTIALDSYGNAIGGWRLSAIQFATAQYDIFNPPMPGYTADWCAAKLRGYQISFSTAQINHLYPLGQLEYIGLVASYDAEQVAAGYLLLSDAVADINQAFVNQI